MKFNSILIVGCILIIAKDGYTNEFSSFMKFSDLLDVKFKTKKSSCVNGNKIPNKQSILNYYSFRSNQIVTQIIR